jgi:hypothetical protein
MIGEWTSFVFICTNGVEGGEIIGRWSRRGVGGAENKQGLFAHIIVFGRWRRESHSFKACGNYGQELFVLHDKMADNYSFKTGNLGKQLNTSNANTTKEQENDTGPRGVWRRYENIKNNP